MRFWKSFVAWPLAAAFAAPVQANSIVVNTVADQYGSDTAHCSLREAVRAANTDAAFGGCTAGGGIDLIDLPDGVFLLTRAGRDEDADATGDLDVAGDGVVVVGNGAAVSIVDGNGLDRIFHVQAGAALLLLSNLTLRNGDPLGGSNADDVYGGAVYMDGSGAISMTNVHVSASRAAQGGGVFVDGGASAFGISGSSFSLNHATDYGGAVLSRRELNATNSTFSGNSTGCVGSAIYFSDVDVEHTLASVTVADNHGGTRSNCIDAPALWNAFSSSATVRVRNSIVARNYSGFIEVNCDEITSDDYNLIGSTEDCDLLGTLTNTLTGVDPQLMPLFDYGNGTPSHMILPGSAAIGAGNPASPGSGGNACPSADQRGVDRSDCDIGAYEYRPTFTVSRQDDAADATPGNGQCNAVGGGCTLRAAIAEANERDEPTTIVLPAGTFRLTLPNVPNQDSGDLELEPAAALAIVGAGAGRSVVLGDGHDDQVFQLFSGANALLRLSVRGGTEQAQVSAGGVAVLNDPALLADVEISDNQGCFGGLHVRDHVIAERVSIHDNLAEVAGGCPYNGGGAYVGSGGVLEMRNSTVSGNRASAGRRRNLRRGRHGAARPRDDHRQRRRLRRRRHAGRRRPGARRLRHGVPEELDRRRQRVRQRHRARLRGAGAVAGLQPDRQRGRLHARRFGRARSRRCRSAAGAAGSLRRPAAGASAAAGQSGPRRRRRRPDLRSPDGLPRRFAAQRGRRPARRRAAGRRLLRHRRVRRQRRFDLRRRLRLSAAGAAGT